MLERDLERAHGSGHPMARVFLQDLLLVLGVRGVALYEDVSVSVDEPGEEGPVPQVDHAHAGRNGVADALDPVARDHDDRSGDVAPGLDVQQSSGPNSQAGLAGLLRTEQVARCQGEQADDQSFHHSRFLRRRSVSRSDRLSKHRPFPV